MTKLSAQEVVNYLPHRYPFLLIDKVLALEVHKKIQAVKNVTINENFFVGHFPNRAVMPGVLMVEAMAQAAAILAYKSLNLPASDTLFYLGSIEHARFKRLVVPGDQLELQVEVLKQRGNIWKFKGQALVDGEIACSTEMTCAQGKVES